MRAAAQTQVCTCAFAHPTTPFAMAELEQLYTDAKTLADEIQAIDVSGVCPDRQQAQDARLKTLTDRLAVVCAEVKKVPPGAVTRPSPPPDNSSQVRTCASANPTAAFVRRQQYAQAALDMAAPAPAPAPAGEPGARKKAKRRAASDDKADGVEPPRPARPARQARPARPPSGAKPSVLFGCNTHETADIVAELGLSVYDRSLWNADTPRGSSSMSAMFANLLAASRTHKDLPGLITEGNNGGNFWCGFPEKALIGYIRMLPDTKHTISECVKALFANRDKNLVMHSEARHLPNADAPCSTSGMFKTAHYATFEAVTCRMSDPSYTKPKCYHNPTCDPKPFGPTCIPYSDVAKRFGFVGAPTAYEGIGMPFLLHDEHFDFITETYDRAAACALHAQIGMHTAHPQHDAWFHGNGPYGWVGLLGDDPAMYQQRILLILDSAGSAGVVPHDLAWMLHPGALDWMWLPSFERLGLNADARHNLTVLDFTNVDEGYDMPRVVSDPLWHAACTRCPLREFGQAIAVAALVYPMLSDVQFRDSAWVRFQLLRTARNTTPGTPTRARGDDGCSVYDTKSIDPHLAWIAAETMPWDGLEHPLRYTDVHPTDLPKYKRPPTGAYRHCFFPEASMWTLARMSPSFMYLFFVLRRPRVCTPDGASATHVENVLRGSTSRHCAFWQLPTDSTRAEAREPRHAATRKETARSLLLEWALSVGGPLWWDPQPAGPPPEGELQCAWTETVADHRNTYSRRREMWFPFRTDEAKAYADLLEFNGHAPTGRIPAPSPFPLRPPDNLAADHALLRHELGIDDWYSAFRNLRVLAKVGVAGRTHDGLEYHEREYAYTTGYEPVATKLSFGQRSPSVSRSSLVETLACFHAAAHLARAPADAYQARLHAANRVVTVGRDPASVKCGWFDGWRPIAVCNHAVARMHYGGGVERVDDFVLTLATGPQGGAGQQRHPSPEMQVASIWDRALTGAGWHLLAPGTLGGKLSGAERTHDEIGVPKPLHVSGNGPQTSFGPLTRSQTYFAEGVLRPIPTLQRTLLGVPKPVAVLLDVPSIVRFDRPNSQEQEEDDLGVPSYAQQGQAPQYGMQCYADEEQNAPMPMASLRLALVALPEWVRLRRAHEFPLHTRESPTLASVATPFAAALHTLAKMHATNLLAHSLLKDHRWLENVPAPPGKGPLKPVTEAWLLLTLNLTDRIVGLASEVGVLLCGIANDVSPYHVTSNAACAVGPRDKQKFAAEADKSRHGPFVWNEAAATAGMPSGVWALHRRFGDGDVAPIDQLRIDPSCTSGAALVDLAVQREWDPAAYAASLELLQLGLAVVRPCEALAANAPERRFRTGASVAAKAHDNMRRDRDLTVKKRLEPGSTTCDPHMGMHPANALEALRNLLVPTAVRMQVTSAELPQHRMAAQCNWCISASEDVLPASWPNFDAPISASDRVRVVENVYRFLVLQKHLERSLGGGGGDRSEESMGWSMHPVMMQANAVSAFHEHWTTRKIDGIKRLFDHVASRSTWRTYEAEDDFDDFDVAARTTLPGAVMGVARRADIPTADLFEGLAPNTQGRRKSATLGDGVAEVVSPLQTEHDAADPEVQDAQIKDFADHLIRTVPEAESVDGYWNLQHRVERIAAVAARVAAAIVDQPNLGEDRWFISHVEVIDNGRGRRKTRRNRWKKVRFDLAEHNRAMSLLEGHVEGPVDAPLRGSDGSVEASGGTRQWLDYARVDERERRTRLAALDVPATVHMALRVWHTQNILKPQLEAAIEQRVVASVARMCHRRKLQTANKLMPCGRFETTPGRLVDALERRQRDAQATGFRLKAALRRAVQHRRQRRAPACQ